MQRSLFYFRLFLGLWAVLTCHQQLFGQLLPKNYLIANAVLITAVDDEVLEDACLLIRNGRIAGIYDDISDVPKAYDTVLNMKGKFIMPGLIDSHNHLSGRRITDKALENALSNGITCVRDMGGDCAYLNILREDIQNGVIAAPDIYFSALVGGEAFIQSDRRAISSTPEKYEIGQAPGMRSVNDSTDLDQLMLESVDLGATGVKIYSHLSPALIRGIAQKAHQYGLKVWAHGIVPPSGLEEVVAAGVNSISHINFFLMPDHWDLKKHGTMAFDSAQIRPDRLRSVFMSMKAQNIFLDPTIFLGLRMANLRISDSVDRMEYKNALIFVLREAWRQGVKIVAGTDIFLSDKKGYVPELHDEMKVYAREAGIPNYEVIRMATIYGAELLGMEGQFGSIEKGKQANLLVLNANPLQNIDNTKNIHLVIKNGISIKL